MYCQPHTRAACGPSIPHGQFNPDSDADRLAHGHGHSDCHGHEDCHSKCNDYSIANVDPTAHSNLHPIAHAYAFCDAKPDEHAPAPSAHDHTHRDDHAYADGDADPNPHVQPDPTAHRSLYE